MAQLFTLTDPVTGHRKYLNREERKAFFAATQLQEAKVKYLSGSPGGDTGETGLRKSLCHYPNPEAGKAGR